MSFLYLYIFSNYKWLLELEVSKESLQTEEYRPFDKQNCIKTPYYFLNVCVVYKSLLTIFIYSLLRK